MNDNDFKLVKLIILKNIITVICTMMLVLGLYYMSNSFYSLFGLILIASITTNIKTKK